jgi:hypothetical protein
MSLKEQIKERGLKFVWVADQIKIPRSSFIVYMNHPTLMPNHVEEKIKEFLK